MYIETQYCDCCGKLIQRGRLDSDTWDRSLYLVMPVQKEIDGFDYSDVQVCADCYSKLMQLATFSARATKGFTRRVNFKKIELGGCEPEPLTCTMRIACKFEGGEE